MRIKLSSDYTLLNITSNLGAKLHVLRQKGDIYTVANFSSGYGLNSKNGRRRLALAKVMQQRNLNTGGDEMTETLPKPGFTLLLFFPLVGPIGCCVSVIAVSSFGATGGTASVKPLL